MYKKIEFFNILYLQFIIKPIYMAMGTNSSKEDIKSIKTETNQLMFDIPITTLPCNDDERVLLSEENIDYLEGFFDGKKNIFKGIQINIPDDIPNNKYRAGCSSSELNSSPYQLSEGLCSSDPYFNLKEKFNNQNSQYGYLTLKS